MSCRATALHHGCTDAAARTAKVSSLSTIRAYARSRNDSRLRELRRSSLPQPCPNVATALKHESLVWRLRQRRRDVQNACRMRNQPLLKQLWSRGQGTHGRRQARCVPDISNSPSPIINLEHPCALALSIASQRGTHSMGNVCPQVTIIDNAECTRMFQIGDRRWRIADP